MQCGVLERVYFVECGVYIVETGLPSVGCVECVESVECWV